jgi:hypothetical protein
VTRTVAYVRLDSSDGYDPPFIDATIDPTREEEGFTDLRQAIEWARDRSDRVLVRVDRYEWSAGSTQIENTDQLTADDLMRANATVAREFERHAAESTPSDRPQAWYLLVFKPDVRGPLEPAETMVRQLPGVERLERLKRGDDHLWLIECQGRSERDVQQLDTTVARALWPDERITAEFEEGGVMFGSGDQQRIGLVQFKDRCDLLR